MESRRLSVPGRWTIAVLTVAILSLTSPAALAQVRQPVRVARTRGWMRPYYVWLSKDELLVFKGKVAEDYYDTVERAMVFSVRTRRSRPLDWFDRRWARWVAQTDRRAVDWASVSPDGRWLLLEPVLIGNTNLNDWIAATVDGRRWIEHRDAGGIQPPAWLRAGRAFLSLEYRSSSPAGIALDEFTPLDPDPTRDIALPERQFPTEKNGGHYLLGEVPDGRILACLRGPWRPRIPFFAAEIGRGDTAKVFPFEVDLPAAESDGRARPSLADVVLSPGGDRLAWCFEHGNGEVTIWISRWDGSGMRQAGFLPRQPYDWREEQEEDVRALQWSQDGSRVSFIRRRALYVLAVD